MTDLAGSLCRFIEEFYRSKTECREAEMVIVYAEELVKRLERLEKFADSVCAISRQDEADYDDQMADIKSCVWRLESGED